LTIIADCFTFNLQFDYVRKDAFKCKAVRHYLHLNTIKYDANAAGIILYRDRYVINPDQAERPLAVDKKKGDQLTALKIH